MIWIIKMLIETPRAVFNYRRDYYNHKKVKKVIKNDGLVAGFFEHDKVFGAVIEEWMALCEYINDAGNEIPQELINMAMEKGWLALKPEQESEIPEDTSLTSWEEWENAS